MIAPSTLQIAQRRTVDRYRVAVVSQTAEQPTPAPTAVAAPAVATSVVNPTTADLLETPNASGKRLGVLHHGETLQVMSFPAARDQKCTNLVPTMGNPLTGFARTGDRRNPTA
jgi:hypothetical protein